MFYREVLYQNIRIWDLKGKASEFPNPVIGKLQHIVYKGCENLAIPSGIEDKLLVELHIFVL